MYLIRNNLLPNTGIDLHIGYPYWGGWIIKETGIKVKKNENKDLAENMGMNSKG